MRPAAGGRDARERGPGWHSRGVHRWNELSAVPTDLGPCVVTIGNFDGVHRGHQAVLRRLVEVARSRGATAVAVTFDPHPLAVLYPERAPAALCGPAHRLDLLAETGLDAVLVLPFTPELARWSPERFVTDVLVSGLHAVAVVVGRDTRFGHRNSGDVDTLRRAGAEHGFDVLAVEDLGLGLGAGETAAGADHEPHRAGGRWSSTAVRELLAAGDVAGAAAVLGRPHRVTGTVVHGDHRGRELGYPTANLSQDAEGMVPADGVYAGWLVRADGDRMPAAISIGTNPTFDGHQRRVESYVLDRTDLDLYGEQVGVEVVARLRPTLRFDGIEPLLVQMAQDVAQCHELLGVPVPPAARSGR
jgi:riboflavin kinase / FMN adenylyltransferase